MGPHDSRSGSAHRNPRVGAWIAPEQRRDAGFLERVDYILAVRGEQDTPSVPGLSILDGVARDGNLLPFTRWIASACGRERS